MALTKGDEVKNKYNIKGFTEIPAETSGAIEKIHYVTNTVDVKFYIYGREVVKYGIKMADIKKA